MSEREISLNERESETLDRLYLEWSQFTRAKTFRDLANEQRIRELGAEVEQLRTCKTCGQDKVIAEIGAQFGYRADIMGLEVKNLRATLRAVGELLEKWRAEELAERTACPDDPHAMDGDDCADELEALLK